jgi:hypothetical protein
MATESCGRWSSRQAVGCDADSSSASGVEHRTISTAKSPIPPPGRTVSNSAAQTIEQAKPIPNASAIESGSSSSPLQGRPIAQQEVRTNLNGTSSALSSRAKVLIVPPAGVSGRWIESSNTSAETEFPGGLILVQQDGALSGFGALNSDHRCPIIHGSVNGNFVKFELSDGRESFLYSLKLEGEELRGTLTISSRNETRTAAVRLQRTQ